jgi:hypothetical protein
MTAGCSWLGLGDGFAIGCAPTPKIAHAVAFADKKIQA